MERRFVKLGEQYYVVQMHSDKGLTLVPATAEDVHDEQFEVAALLDGDAMDVGNDNFLQQVIDSTQGEMVKSLKQGIKKTVLGCLGFSERNWGNSTGFEVDHCNQRMSEVTNHITVTLKQILRDATIEELGLTEKERAGLIAAYRKDLLNQYNDKLRHNIWHMVNHLAVEDAKKVAESLLKDRNEKVGAIILDKLFNKARYKV